MIRMYTQSANFTSPSLDKCLANLDLRTLESARADCRGPCAELRLPIAFFSVSLQLVRHCRFPTCQKACQQAREPSCNFATQALDAHAAMPPCKSASHCCPCPASASWSLATHLRIAQLEAQSTPQATKDRPITSPEPGHSGTRTEVREQGQARQNHCSMDTCGQSSRELPSPQHQAPGILPYRTAPPHTHNVSPSRHGCFGCVPRGAAHDRHRLHSLRPEGGNTFRSLLHTISILS
ncbi:hypothetical protein CCHR01_10051 [Colletotrichum chrysophilum]|uniref:Uncharacterized protein n=1 Tax=Colletotrichum chrysophilum TaxID=1836956 RepID=A0AAD9EH55_9PEZI|nr:hypothetical protein CCHR01_10051 [Colletotrichum chrysophilum]